MLFKIRIRRLEPVAMADGHGSVALMPAPCAHTFHRSKSRGGQQIRAQGVDEDWPVDRCDRKAVDGFIIAR